MMPLKEEDLFFTCTVTGTNQSKPFVCPCFCQENDNCILSSGGYCSSLSLVLFFLQLPSAHLLADYTSPDVVCACCSSPYCLVRAWDGPLLLGNSCTEQLLAECPDNILPHHCCGADVSGSQLCWVEDPGDSHCFSITPDSIVFFFSGPHLSLETMNLLLLMGAGSHIKTTTVIKVKQDTQRSQQSGRFHCLSCLCQHLLHFSQLFSL